MIQNLPANRLKHMAKGLLGFIAAALLPATVFATDPPHTDGNDYCSSCHLVHRSLGAPLFKVPGGNVNLCQSCHVPGGTASTQAMLNSDQAMPAPGLPPGTVPTGNSHRWDSSASGRVVYLGGAATPSVGAVLSSGTNSGPYAQTYTLTIASAGDVGAARFNWSVTIPGGGYATNAIGGFGNNLLTGTNVALTNGISVTFASATNSFYQVNDQWQILVRAGLRHPTNTDLLANLPGGQMMCSTCHNPHSQANSPFDPTAPAYTNGFGEGRHYQAMDNRFDQMCLDCHAARGVTNSILGSHPVIIPITTNAYYRAPASLPLTASGSCVACETCHDVHLAPDNDGNLVRMTNRLAFCTECHTLADTTTPGRHLNVTNSALWPGGRTNCSTFPPITDTTLRGACENCHQAHGWPMATNTALVFPKLLVDQEESLCFTCHGTNGPATMRVEADFSKTYHHLVSDAQQTQGRVVECSSCHNPHKALSGSHTYTNTATATRNLASNPLKGADGVACSYLGLTNFQAVTTNLYTVIPRSTGVTNEYQICFKCHSSFAYGTNPPAGLSPIYSTGTATFTSGNATVTGSGTTWNTGMVGAWIVRSNNAGTPYKIAAVASTTSLTISPVYAGASGSAQAYRISCETDAAQEFSPQNRSGHPVVTGLDNYPNSLAVGSPARKGLQPPALKAPWNVNVGQQTMMCSDCHNTDAATPAAQGPHGSASQFMLRGPNAANWPDVTLPNFTNSWCANCHNNSAGTPHTRSNHRGTSVKCYTCHIVVPHGGKMSRLIADRDGTMPARYAFNNTITNVGMMQYTKAATNSYTENSNCRTSCGHHGSGTGNENW